MINKGGGYNTEPPKGRLDKAKLGSELEYPSERPAPGFALGQAYCLNKI